VALIYIQANLGDEVDGHPNPNMEVWAPRVQP